MEISKHDILITRSLPEIGEIVHIESIDSEMTGEVIAHDGEFHILCIPVGAIAKRLYEQGKIKPTRVTVNRGQLDRGPLDGPSEFGNDKRPGNLKLYLDFETKEE